MNLFSSLRSSFAKVAQSLGNRLFGDRLFWIKYRFDSDRPQYYANLAARMRAAPSEPFEYFFAKDIERFANEPRGVLSALWFSRVRGTEGERQVPFLSEIFAGTVPQEDIALLAVTEKAGDIKDGLTALSVSVGELDAVKRSLFLIFGAIFGTLIIIHVNVFFFSYIQVPTIEEAMTGLLTLKDFGPLGKFNHWSALVIRMIGWLFVLSEIALVVWVRRALPSYVGRYRPWLDKWFLPFRFYRSFHSLQFVNTLATITSKVGKNAQLNLTEGLEKMREHAFPYMRMHIEQILMNLEYAPHSSGTVFDTGLFNREALHWIYDLSDHEPDLSVRLRKLSTELLTMTRPALEKMAHRLNNIAMVTIVVFLVGGYVSQAVTSQEFNHQFKLHHITGQ